jgi:hypothetical protein
MIYIYIVRFAVKVKVAEAEVEVEVEFATDSRSACLSWYRATIWSPGPDFSFLSDNCGFLDVGRPL